MKKEELIDKIDEAIVKMKEETNKGVIKEHMISSVVNWKTGEETGQAAVLTCRTKFEYTEDVLKRWKEQLGADEYRIKVNRSQMFITFIVPYKKEDWSMRTIFKTKLDVCDYQTVALPHDYKIIHVAMQQGTPCIWYECTPDMPLVKVEILCFGTGCRMPDPGTPDGAIEHIGSVVDGFYVWHFYRKF